MKKIVLNAVKILLLIMVVFEYVAIIPVNAITINEEETLGDYKKALKKLEADAKAQKEKEKLTQSQINSNYNKQINFNIPYIFKYDNCTYNTK